MRFYSPQVVRHKIERMQNTRIETRDAVITAIDLGARIATVKIQGSDKDIYARWPENFEEFPQFLRVGNSVRISHPEGNQGRIEIVGHGILMPTTAGGGIIPQPPVPQGDGIVWGATVQPTYPTASMSISVTTGEIRINGIEYTLNILLMGSGLGLMGTGTPMGAFSGSVTFDAASATLFRYDLVVAGVDGIVEIVKGTEAAVDPVMPALPSNHVRIAHVLLHPNLTAIEPHDINALYTTPKVSAVRLTFSVNPMHGDSVVNDHFDETSQITVLVSDQYGNKVAKVSPGHLVRFSFFRGNGDIVCGGVPFDETSGEQTFYTTDGQITMTYTRRATHVADTYARNGEESPSFNASTFTTLNIPTISSLLALWNDFDEDMM